MSPIKAPGMQVLTDQIEEARPGTTIYGIGDEEHQEHTSGHNPDDTSGVSAEDQDADSIPEFRAIDVMPGSTFSGADGDALVHDLTTIPENQVRIIYVNWGNYQYHRKNGFRPEWNGDDPHGHVHVSGEADADANTSPWKLPTLEASMETEWSKANPLGPDPDGAHRSPLQHERDVWAALMSGQRPRDSSNNPVGAEAWIIGQFRDIQVMLDKILSALESGVSVVAVVDLSAGALDQVEGRMRKVESDVLAGGASAVDGNL